MKKKKRHKMFWVTIITILLLITGAVILLNQDSERIVENRFIENEIDKFDAAKYPLVIDKNKYPELSANEKDIAEEYKTILQIFVKQRYEKYDYQCELPPTVSKLNFNHLKPKQNIYLIESYCRISGDISPHNGVPDILFYAKREDNVVMAYEKPIVVAMFYKKYVAEHFTEIFENIKNSDQLKEYSELHGIKLFADLNSALNNSVLKRYGQENFKKNCNFVSEIPKLASTISKEENIFIHRGLIIEPEIHARLYYFKYNITSDGRIIRDTRKMLALCPTAGIIY